MTTRTDSPINRQFRFPRELGLVTRSSEYIDLAISC